MSEWEKREVPCEQCEEYKANLSDALEIKDECPEIPEKPGFCEVWFR
jgi:hypothetical protein